MRTIPAIPLCVLFSTGAAFAQPAPRFEIGPVVRVDQVFVEAGGSGSTLVGGITARVNLSKTFGVEAELTRASNPIARSYEGWFISFAGPGSTREQIERLAPTARRSLAYIPGTGGSAAFVVRGEVSPRIAIGLRAGVSARRYEETSTYTMLTIPDGIDPALVARNFQASSAGRIRGGLLFGSDVAVAVTDRLRLVPEIRFVYGGPARVGNKHREIGLGLRAVWGF